MTDRVNNSPLENDIRKLLAVSEPQETFRKDLYNQLKRKHTSTRSSRPRGFSLKPAFVALLVAITILIASLFYYGPEVVYATITRLFDYIPGIGLVDQGTSIRVLKEPVSQIQDGITITVYEATLTDETTEIKFGITGVPLSAYSHNKVSTEGCTQQEYILLPDGKQLEMGAPIPADDNEAVLIIPCIFNTLPGKVPTDWEIPLEFIPLPEDVTAYPVEESSPEPQEELTHTPAPDAESKTTNGADTAVKIKKTIQTDEGYILIGSIEVNADQNIWVNMTGIPEIMDVNGNKIPYEYPSDIQLSSIDNNHIPWAVQFDAANVSFPVTLDFHGEGYIRIEPDTPVYLTFDAGDDPQPGQKWDIHKSFSMGDYQFILETIQASNDGYSFTFDTTLNDEEIMSPPSVEIIGYQALGGGGGKYSNSLAFAEIPKGSLELELSGFTVQTQQYFWSTQWKPENLEAHWPTPTPISDGLCINEENYQNIAVLPDSYSGGIIRTEMNPEVNIAATDLKGDNRKVFEAGSNRGSLSPDGRQLAYGNQEGLQLVDLGDGSKTFIPDIGSHELRWSPNGRKIALVNPDGNFGVFIFDLDNRELTQVSNLGYETIAGWSMDGRQLTYSIPGSSQEGFLLRRFDLDSKETMDLFVLEDSSMKSPMPRISPDDQWIAYRSRFHNQVNLISIDGKQSRVVFSLPADQFVITGIQWEINSGWLAISTSDYGSAGSDQLYIMDISSCSSFTFNNYKGELNGIWIDPQ